MSTLAVNVLCVIIPKIFNTQELFVVEYALIEDEDERWFLGHQFEDMVIYADYAYKDVFDNFEHLFNPILGNCFTFNHFNKANRTMSAREGSEHGRKLGYRVSMTPN